MRLSNLDSLRNQPGRASLSFSDMAIFFCLGLTMGSLTYFNAGKIDPYFYETYLQIDVWFQSDIPIRFGMLTDFAGEWTNDKTHLLLPPLGFIPVAFLTQFLGLSSVQACHIVMAAVAASWSGVLYITLRLLHMPKLDAGIFTTLGIFSAASVFWFSVPESFSFGSLGILITLMLVAWSEIRPVSIKWYVILGAINLGTTITNVMVVFFALIVNFSIAETFLALFASAILFLFFSALVVFRVPPYIYVIVIGVLSGLFWRFQPRLKAIWESLVQIFQERWFKRIFWGAFGLSMLILLVLLAFSSKVRGMALSPVAGKLQYIFHDASGGIDVKLQSIFAHTMIMPEIRVVPSTWHAETGVKILLTQMSSPGSGTDWGIAAVGLWTALLGLGIWGFFSIRQHKKFRIVLGILLVAQISLHLVFGEETFLYALHFSPILILVAALSALTPARFVALALSGLLLITMSVNNFHQYQTAMDILAERQAESVTVP